MARPTPSTVSWPRRPRTSSPRRCGRPSPSSSASCARRNDMRGVIFDLDGTLVDSLGDIAAAMNRSLAARGFPTHPVDAYRTFIGEGVQKLAERALPPGKQEEKAALLQAYQADYAENLLETSAPYPGIPELLDALST